MGSFSGRRAFRVIREVQITRVEFADVPGGEISTLGHKEPLHGWDLAQSRRVVSIEEVAFPDEATLAMAPHTQVEYVTADMSREHDGINVYIPLPLVELLGSVETAFEACTDEDRSAIVSYDESFDPLYTADGDFWEGDEEVMISLLPGQPTDGLTFVQDAIGSTRTPLDEQDAAPPAKYRVLLGEQGVPAVVAFSEDEPDRERFVGNVFHTREGAELALVGYRLLHGEMLSSEERQRLIQILTPPLKESGVSEQRDSWMGRKETIPITLPQAIRRAVAEHMEQCFDSYKSDSGFGPPRYNVVLAAFLAAGKIIDFDWDEAANDDYVFQETEHLGWHLDQVICGPDELEPVTRLDALLYMNDTGRWPFLKIAEWLEEHDSQEGSEVNGGGFVVG